MLLNIKIFIKKRFNCYKIFILYNILIIYFIIIYIIPIIIYNKKRKYNEVDNDFFYIKEVNEQILAKNLTHISTIFGEYKKVGNSLIILNNLINACERIKCQNVITPSGLKMLIKKPILHKMYNITIYPYSYHNKIKIDIKLLFRNIFYFKFSKKPRKNRLSLLRQEIISNIPKFVSNRRELIIKIRSGDIFVNSINPHYSQPPLCFYQKIINNNKFDKIYILSNGHQNPVVDKLLHLYPKIKYIEGTIPQAVSMIIYSYNLVYSVSTFQSTLMQFNYNLINLYVYEFSPYNRKNINYRIYKMKPSDKYLTIMKNNWKNTKEQLDLMINEKCLNTPLICSKQNHNYII